MNCDKCGKEIGDYKEGELRVCVECLKAIIEKFRYMVGNKKELRREHEEG